VVGASFPGVEADSVQNALLARPILRTCGTPLEPPIEKYTPAALVLQARYCSTAKPIRDP